MKRIILLVVILAFAGCATQFPVPDTLGDPKNASNYGYHPLDPLPVNLTIDRAKVLDAMPDETIRIAVGTVSSNGGITFGPAKIGAEGKNYVVILDYIKFGTDSFGVALSGEKDNRVASLVKPNEISKANAVVPVYIGVGLRLTANIYVKKGEVDLGNLFALGAAAKAEQVSGTLVIQTLGVSGPEISGLIPMPGEISESTIQNAILALASIKAKVYDTKTSITPRVVGVYNNLGGGETTINGFISSLLEQPIPFPRANN
ncbi:hypothetical protein Q9252_00025 [Marinobacter salarius]|uniref:hypothetical protein n=1 Tax=Marinobacter salarius TaxID=1420917 RepID=UPI00273B1473|nr:hypothetical protein [Marinobacter salarius]MDP4530502.1 hypothetical protein [Marinobacter salarius]